MSYELNVELSRRFGKFDFLFLRGENMKKLLWITLALASLGADLSAELKASELARDNATVLSANASASGVGSGARSGA